METREYPRVISLCCYLGRDALRRDDYVTIASFYFTLTVRLESYKGCDYARFIEDRSKYDMTFLTGEFETSVGLSLIMI